MIRLEIVKKKLNKVDCQVTRYVNDNLKCIIRVLIDFLEDDNDFVAEDFLPENNLRIDNEVWCNMVYDLYDVVCSEALRDYIKPKYQYLLYGILLWWEECSDDNSQLLPVKLDSEAARAIGEAYPSEDGGSYVLRAITDYKEYYNILFEDYDFMPDTLGNFIITYLRSKKMFAEFFPDVDLEEYHDLMPKDLQELYDEAKQEIKEDEYVDIEKMVYDDIIFCCETVQADISLKNALENTINDSIRNLLKATKIYCVSDQTRRGASGTGKEAGNVDILVEIGQYPVTLIEALKLDSIKEKYISDHVDKIYKYDTLGHNFNFLISYVTTKNFKCFFERYTKFVCELKYPYKLKSYEINEAKQYSEIRTIEMVLDRQVIDTKL